MPITLLCPACEGKLWRRKRCDTESCDRYQEAIEEPIVDSEDVVRVGDLKERLEDIPDETLVAVDASGAWNFCYNIEETEMGPGIPVIRLTENRYLFA